jgi:hypothetical protein
MNKKQVIPLLSVVALLVIFGWLLFKLINRDVTFISAEESFQTWIWEKRSLDLAVQLVLIFAGTLGIAAILPMEDEDHD